MDQFQAVLDTVGGKKKIDLAGGNQPVGGGGPDQAHRRGVRAIEAFEQLRRRGDVRLAVHHKTVIRAGRQVGRLGGE